MDEPVEIQIKVPVCLTLRMSREAAEKLYHDDLCRIVDQVLETIAEKITSDSKMTPAIIDDETDFVISYALAPHWDHLPEDDCELTSTEEGLFPTRD
jgi:hypothetical protein